MATKAELEGYLKESQEYAKRLEDVVRDFKTEIRQKDGHVDQLREQLEAAERTINSTMSSFQKLAGAYIEAKGDRDMFDKHFPELRHVDTYGCFKMEENNGYGPGYT